ncbi:MAG: GUN4 domain-containing protein [Xenococcaceae cyanobacterium MO_167.B27]|nr:GUN4 domain-containing protein [Xenococcaceae cyanobacterium MO_167.B27]
MSNPVEPEKKQEKEKEKDDFEKERKASLGFISQLVRYAPTGGSIGLIASFILDNEVLKALFTFPFMVGAVAWAAYSKSFLLRIQEIMEEEGKKGAESLIAQLQKLDSAIKEAIKWQLAGTDDKYLKCQGSFCRDYETIGFNQPSGIFMPLLKDVFVPLELSDIFIKDCTGDEFPGLPGFNRIRAKSERGETTAEPLIIWDLLSQTRKNPAFRRLAILAWGGFGKSTLLRHVTYSYMTKQYKRYKAPKLLPVLLYLRQWQELLANNPPDLPTLIEQHHIPYLPEDQELKLPPGWAKNHLRKGNMLVMFDGFDEVKEEQREFLSQWLNNQIGSYPNSTFIITSRPRAFKAHKNKIKLRVELFVKEFNQEQQRRFISQWYKAQEINIRAGRNDANVQDRVEKQTANLLQQLQDREELGALAKNPLLLNMIVNLHRSYQGQPLPQRRAELYQDICTFQLKDRPRARGIDMPLPLAESQQLLQGVALDMMQKVQEPRISAKDLTRLIDKQLRILDTQDPVTSDEFLNKIRDVSELIVKREEEYEFAHLSFQEFLAAKQIKETKQEQLLLDNWQSQWWRGTILLYAALVNPTNLIRSLIALNNEEANTLALRCLEETPRKIDPEIEGELTSLESNVQNQLYQSLETYLKNGQWREADEETLKVMLKVADREEQGWLDIDSIKNFRCEDLRIIDQLWVKYSKGKFGFSVQKEIIVSLAGTEEYNKKIFQDFCDRISWRKGGKYLRYSDLTFNWELAPTAHLPGAWAFLGLMGFRSGLGGAGTGVGCLLFSRAKICNL